MFIVDSIHCERSVSVVSSRIAGDHPTGHAQRAKTSTQNAGKVPALTKTYTFLTTNVLGQDFFRTLPTAWLFSARKVFRPISYAKRCQRLNWLNWLNSLQIHSPFSTPLPLASCTTALKCRATASGSLRSEGRIDLNKNMIHSKMPSEYWGRQKRR